MTDVKLTRALERGEVANHDFRHASHLHVAWVYLTESSSTNEAACKMRATLRRFASSLGHLEKYHETITLFWIHFLARERAMAADKSLEQIVKANRQLLEKRLPTYLLFATVALQRSRTRVVARARPETFSQRCLLSFFHPKRNYDSRRQT